MKKLLLILLFTPLILFSQETEVKNVINLETIKDEYIKITDGITYYNGKPYTGVSFKNFENGQLHYKYTYKNGKYVLFQQYRKDGQFHKKVNYKDGKKDGLEELHYPGTIEKTNYKDGKKYGLQQVYFINGKLLRKSIWKDNMKDGLSHWYYDDGQLKSKTYYKDGKEDGLTERYYKDGQLIEKTNYKEGYKVLEKRYYGNGQLAVIIRYKANYEAKFEPYADADNYRNGLTERYYKDGQLKEKTNYKYGKKDGLYEFYYENGQLNEKLLYKNDVIKINFLSVIGDTNVEDVNVYDLEAMIKLFLKDCELNNIKLSSDYKITSTFETLNEGVLAKAYGIFNDEEIIIKVSPQEWSKASNPKRWYILYHELGHDVLNLQHGQGGKMMFNFTEEDYTWDDFFKDKDYMFNSMNKE
tara:strand:- start:984 stop:2222 length:1239 start_codon:yes stop_codon:yes gene_type:complete